MEEHKKYFLYGYLLAIFNTKKKLGGVLSDVELKHYKFSDLEVEEAFKQYRDVTYEGTAKSITEVINSYLKSDK